LSPQPNRRHCLLGDFGYDHGGARAVVPASPSTAPDDDGLTAATEAPPLWWDEVQQYSASDTSTPEPHAIWTTG
jgi:hypothetical protein